MRLTLRLLFSLVAGVGLVAFLFAYFQLNAEKRGLRNELANRARTQAESLQQAIEPSLVKEIAGGLAQIIQRFREREQLAAVVVYDSKGRTLVASPSAGTSLPEGSDLIRKGIEENQSVGEFFYQDGVYMHAEVVPLHRQDAVAGAVAIIHDASYIASHQVRQWRRTFLRVLAQVALIVIITLLIIRWSIVGPIARTAQWMREQRAAPRLPRPAPPEAELFKPLAQEVTHLFKSLETARAAAAEEARLRDASESLWTAERLRAHVRGKLRGSPLFVVSNREPYIHVRRGRSIELMVPASGLVTALEPVLRACDGTWIAHGSGDADAEAVDKQDRLRVPPDEPEYTLRRVWLTKEEEEGYYYGFANEGLWPLCHIAHTRPIFRTADWQQYQEVNRKFAQVSLKEMEGVGQPLLLVQDYHFALLPRQVKEHRPDARVAIFWHIPWPNPEAFGICPWQKELLEGLLSADLIGFHIQAHCNNFLETVDMALESQIEWERFAVNRTNHTTLVRPFPISVAFGDLAGSQLKRSSPVAERAVLFKELGVSASFMGIGVDRVDYTKGILERFHGVERFFEKWPAYRGKFTFVQIAAPSRTHIKRYHDLIGEIEQETERINWRFQTDEWKPIVLLVRHHSHAEILPYYRAADLCLVTSLHDGMNLVAKEFIASRDDESGVLVLSCFTGAARELRDALIVNPYDTERLASAIHHALEMDPDDVRVRMQRSRQVLGEHNVYRWAGNLIGALSEIRAETARPARA